jgi:hypothetical protein
MSLTFQRDELIVPPGTLKAWQGPEALKFRSVVANEFDNLAITAELVGDARSPLKCDPTVLPYHARDRKISRYATETESSWRKRLSKWRQIWGSAGRAWGILRQLRIMLAPYGRPMLRYVSTSGSGTHSQWFTLVPGDGRNDYFELGGLDPEFSRDLQSPGNWIWDAGATGGLWSRYWVLIYTSGITAPYGSSTWDVSGTWDDPAESTYWDGYFSAAQMADFAQMCIDWGAAHSKLAGLFLVHDDMAFDPSGSGSGYPNGNWNLLVDPTTGAPTRREGVTYSIVRT